MEAFHTLGIGKKYSVPTKGWRLDKVVPDLPVCPVEFKQYLVTNVDAEELDDSRSMPKLPFFGQAPSLSCRIS
ncbi:MAG: hypothetical protein U0401_19780 [Anaerolineae bacterium]